MTRLPHGSRPASTVREGRLKRLQDVVVETDKSIRALGGPDLGPAFSSLTGQALADALVKHRWRKTMELPGTADAAKRRLETIRSTIAFDSQGMDSLNWRAFPANHRRRWLLARDYMAQLWKGFRPSYKFVAPSGASSTQSFGCDDIMFKLSDPSFWEVSPSALPYATKIAYTNSAVKSIVRKHFVTRCGHMGWDPSAWKLKRREEYFSGPRSVSVGFYVFSCMFKAVVSLSDVSRMSTVPKSVTKDRPIDMVPYWNMVCQLSLMSDMRAVLRDRLGVYVEDLASLHRTLIRHPGYATIDLRNASNSVWKCVVKDLWPSGICRHLMSLRTNHTCYNDGDVENYHVYKMFGPMGTGLTFDVMTITLMAYGRATGDFISVFGDDIIIKRQFANEFCEFIELTGLIVNDDKSFYDGSFRESCGGYHDLVAGEDLLSFDMHYPESLFKAFVLFNKMLKIIQHGQISPELEAVLVASWQRARAIIPLRFSVRCGDVDCGALVDPFSVLPEERTERSRVLTQMWQRTVVQSISLTGQRKASTLPLLGRECGYRYARRSYDPPVGDVFYVTTAVDPVQPLTRLGSVELVTLLPRERFGIDSQG